MRQGLQSILLLTAALAAAPSASSFAAEDSGMASMPGMAMPPDDTKSNTKSDAAQKPAADMPGMDMSHGMAGMNMPGMDMSAMQMHGALGPYSMSREASGTAWQPDSTPMEAIHGTLDSWSTMVHGDAFLIYDNQGGPRGDSKTFSNSMLMGMAQRNIDTGTLTLRGMFSLDPLMGKNGYPLLLQTGETADGVHPLIDRQHPHDLLMELASVYSAPLGEGSAFLYAGYPGEPALGPATFMHRFSGMDNPEAPIGHHWEDSTHVTFGVVTAGYVWQQWKIEGSVFNGREPDQERWNFDPLRLNSESVRLSWNPNANWSAQVSWGTIHSPEQLEPGIDQRRTTASVSYNCPIGGGNWQTTFVWGQNDNSPGLTSNAYLLESTFAWDRHTVFARAEDVRKDELFQPPSALAGEAFDVGKASVGYIYDIPLGDHVKLGLGGLVSAYDIPDTAKAAYGSPTSYMLFTRLKLM
jgi:hypothetical protein